MAAPSTTVWGNIVTESTSAAKIGIYTALSSTATQTTVTIQVWLASKWSLLDSDYSFYFNNNATSATTRITSGLPQINVTVATGSGWSDSNQVKLYTFTTTYNRGTSAQTVNCAAKLANIDRFSGKTMTVSTSYTIPALSSYTVSYVANGGTGAPAKQTKWYGKTLTLSSTKPTRTGYSFLGWSTSSTATTATYAAGASFTANANTNLYAVWKANTYTVSYNANGGSGAPSSQTKTYGVALTLSSTKPTRANYNFLGWGTSASSTTVAYSAGGSYTANSAITLYAVWSLAYTKPRITNISVYRTDSTGASSDTGTYYYISFNWATDSTITALKVARKVSTSTSWTENDFTSGVSGTSGTFTKSALGGSVSTESSHDIRITVSDASGTSYAYTTLPGIAYLIDFKKNGTGVAIGKPAETDNLFDVKYPTQVRGSLYVGDNKKISLREDDEGGNIRLSAPDAYGNYYEIDAYNGNLRFYTYDANETYKDMTFTRDGVLYVDGIATRGDQLLPKESNVPASTTEDTPTYWAAKKTSTYSYNTTGHLVDQPSQWGQLINFTNSYYVAQLWVMATGIFYRGGTNDNTEWTTTWRKLFDTAGGTVDGYTKLNNTINTVGYYRLHTEWIGCYASSANAQASTDRKGWFGFNATNNFTIKNESGGSNITSVAWTTSSDMRMKENIEDIPDVFVNIWNELQSKVFKWNDLNSSNEKYHFGLIAQDVIAAFEKYELDYKEYGFVNSFTLPDDDTEYFGIAYDEYHMLTSLVVKKQQARIDSLEERIEKLEKLILGQEK